MIRHFRAAWAAVLVAGLAGCATPAPRVAEADSVRLLDRVTWGANASSVRHLREIGAEAFMRKQLHPGADATLPPQVQATIDAMTISRRSMAELAAELQAQRQAALAMRDEAAKKAALQAFQQHMTQLAREAATRSLLRAIYSPDQLREQMTWFWMNHFSVFQRKAELRILVADYEENAVRPHALGRFRDLVAATLRHPAMLRYLDNAQSRAGHVNENYARELLELHTLGVDGGYTQRDVQELARVLTGVGMRQGRFEFHPRLHDPGDKVVLGRAIRGRGYAEVDEVLDLLCRHPSTARFVSRKLATFFVSDDPPRALVERMAGTFARTDGDIAATLSTMFASPEFAPSLGGKFKDPMHYVVSAARLVLDGRPLPDAAPLLMWLARLGELPNDHQTPDGYPLVEAAWSSPGQMTTRFEFARAMGSRAPAALERPVSAPTSAALDGAASPRERNALLLSSPDFMYR
ncbi:MAG TPA: DUF1800 domain-containing protein [Usitatibacter sp.]|nr:DUF1800 domain-containing protein [Usitatibacter sp.]